MTEESNCKVFSKTSERLSVGLRSGLVCEIMLFEPHLHSFSLMTLGIGTRDQTSGIREETNLYICLFKSKQRFSCTVSILCLSVCLGEPYRVSMTFRLSFISGSSFLTLFFLISSVLGFTLLLCVCHWIHPTPRFPSVTCTEMDWSNDSHFSC